MIDLIRREDAIDALLEKGQSSRRYKLGEIWELNFDEIREALATVPSAEQRWIPVSERLPEINEHHVSEPCIVYCDNGAMAFSEMLENIFGQWFWECERDDDYHEPVGEVIAWMPLPKPYQEGNQ